MIICKRPDPLDNHLQVDGSFATTTTATITGQKEEKKEKEKEEKEEEKKFLQTGEDGPTEGSTRGPRGLGKGCPERKQFAKKL